jgi:hypothetical protein
MTKPANDNFPLATRLRKARRYAELDLLAEFAGPDEATTWLKARENLPETREGRRGPFLMAMDNRYDERPTMDELAELAAQAAAERRGGCGPVTYQEWHDAWPDVTRHNDRGQMEWRGTDGKWRKVVILSRPRGARAEPESDRREDGERHLRIRATGSLPPATRYEGCQHGDVYWRMRHAAMCGNMCAVNDNAWVLIQLGLDGRHTFAQARANAGLAPATRCGAAVAKGAEFVGGKIDANKGSNRSMAVNRVEDRVIYDIDARRRDKALGAHAQVLQASLLGLTAGDIAASNGWGTTKAAERKAVAAQDAALLALRVFGKAA